jgi:hypothetical protein
MPTLHERNQPLWLPVVAPSVWALHFLVCQVTASLWCGRWGHGAPTNVVPMLVGVYTAMALATITALFVHGYRRRHHQLPAGPHDDDTPEDRQHFVAFTTMLLAGLSFVATVFAAFSIWLVGGCW